MKTPSPSGKAQQRRKPPVSNRGSFQVYLILRLTTKENQVKFVEDLLKELGKLDVSGQVERPKQALTDCLLLCCQSTLGKLQ